MCVCEPPQSEQLVSPVGVISNEAHPFVTHYSVCPPPLSPTSGPHWAPPAHLVLVLLSDFKALLAGCSHRNRAGWIKRRRERVNKQGGGKKWWEGKKRSGGKCVYDSPVLAAMVSTQGTSPCAVRVGGKKGFPLSFLLCTNSHVIALNPSPAPSSQATSMTACLPSLPLVWTPPLWSHTRGKSW